MEPTSDKRSDRRFDPHRAAQLLMEIAQERSLDPILKKIVEQGSEGTEYAFAQVWLVEKGDLCLTCKYRSECADQSRCLHLVAGKGRSILAHGRGLREYEDLNARVPLNFGPLGEAVASGQQGLVTKSDQHPISIAGFDWLREEGVRCFAISPIRFKGEVLGAIVGFTREYVPEVSRPWMAIFADHVGAAIANARAFEEICVAGKRLEQANQTLERELAERKEAEQELRDSEQRYRRLVDTASEGIWELDEQYVTTLVNRRMAEMLGYEPKEMVGRKLHEFLFDDDQAEMAARIAARRQGLTERYEQRYRRQDGSTVWMYVSATSMFDAEHRFIGSFAMLTDITERTRAGEALRRSEAYLVEGQRLSHTGSWAWSPITLQSLYWSEEMFRIFALDPQQGVPTNEVFRERIHPEDRDRAYGFLLNMAHRASNYEHEHRIVLPDGSVKHIHAIGHPVLDEAGKLVEYVGTTMDVTERKRAEDELRKHRENLEDMVRQRTEQLAEAKARAEAANRAKGTFLANMSHELRTPLNAVLGFSRLLKRGPDVTPHQQETLDVIVRSGEHLLNLINNVLDMAKIESGRVALKESEVDLNQLLHEMQSLMGVGAVEKGLRFALERDPDLPRFVAVDAGKLRQVLLNLLGNAIKYTDSGGVKLRSRLASIHGAEKAKVRFEVEDSGPGISQEDCKRIFFPFVQLGDQAPAQAGTGLGLAICKQYVELMGGQIGVASK